MNYLEANTRLRLPFGESGDSWYISALSPKDRCIWKSIAKEKGAKLISPFSKSSWKNNRLLVVDPNNNTPFPYMYIITFEDWDGTVINKIRVAENAVIAPIPDDPERDNYVFDRWETSGGSVLNPGVTTATGDVTYIAQYVSSSYKITWKGNGGTWPGGSTSKTSNANYQDSILSIANASPKGIPTRDEYTFVKWIYNDGSDIGSGDLVEGNVTLKAKWEYTGPTTYTITYLDYDESSIYQTFTNIQEGSSIPRPDTTPIKPPSGGKVYSFTYWVLTDGTDRRLDRDIKTVTGNLTFKPIYNGEDINDGNVKIFDNIGRVKNYTKNTPVNLDKFWPETQNGWWSLPHDGHGPDEGYPDICGKDGGISPLGSETGRYHVPGTKFYFYIDDSVVYEGFTFSNSNHFPTSSDSVTSSDLCTELILLDANGNEQIHITSLDPWIKFVPIDVRINKTAENPEGEPNPTPLTLVDLSNTTKTVTKTIPVSVMIAYYIEDTNEQSAREGKVHVTTAGGTCSYVPEWAPGNQYMTDGNVYFYQLGRTYMPES